MFILHPQLQQDCRVIGRFALCRLLVMKDANYPWFILVPQRDGISEIYQLADSDQQQLMRESTQLATALVRTFAPDKLNIAALGNVVPQLHVHHIVRYRNDPAWPSPVWGRLPALPYADGGLSTLVARLQRHLSPDIFTGDPATPA
ncbi:MAG: HIT domain-containing protein [Gammaproteobacteria bacterium]|nr:HIT domain-containing protein [Gammaproteobacteria bacterium]